MLSQSRSVNNRKDITNICNMLIIKPIYPKDREISNKLF